MSGLYRPAPSRAFARHASLPALLVLFSCVTLPLGSVPAFGALADTGQWTPAKDWRSAVNGYAVHLSLLPGDGSPYHSRLLWYRGESSTYLSGGQWGWKPGSAGCANYPEQSFTFISVPLSGMDLFCNGHAGLQDGRHFMPGGSSAVTGSYGENQSRVFTSGGGTAQGTWATPDEMVEWRWYPTATTLKDGRAMVLGGSRHPYHRIFGGTRDGAEPVSPKGDSLQRFAPLDGGQWDLPVLPVAHLGLRPDVREGHSFLETASLGFADSAGLPAQTLFGGRDSLDGQPPLCQRA